MTEAQMPETKEVPTTVLGEPGERCVECETPLAADQRYCLGCGRRRGPLRVPFREHLEGVEPDATAPLPPPAEVLGAPPRPMRFGPAAAAVGAALLLLALGVGAVLGHAVSKTPKPVRAAAAPVVRVNIPATTVIAAPSSAAPAVAAAFTSDWPDGKDGWTVQLQTLDKASSDPTAVAAAKAQATGQGATAVGALDSDSFSSLTPARYVIYSGDFPSKAKAKTALRGLKKSFPSAKVVHVTGASSAGTVAGAPKRNVSPSQYEKQSKKVKNPISTGGTPPATDKKKAGGGSKVTTIG
jgi:hypothetical protein